MPVTRASDILTQEMTGARLHFLANPSTGASETLVIRGIVSAGATFPAHSHDREEILIIVSGTGAFTVAEETGSVSAGDVVVIPAGALHEFEASDDLDAIGVMPAETKTFAPDGTEMAL